MTTSSEGPLARVSVHVARDPLSGDVFVAARHLIDGQDVVDEVKRYPGDAIGAAITHAKDHLSAAVIEFGYGQTYAW